MSTGYETSIRHFVRGLFEFRHFKVTVDLQRPNFANFFFFVSDIAKISI